MKLSSGINVKKEISSEKIDVVTIDGPAGSGKSTVARAVAKSLDYTFLDTGAMYRAVALGALNSNLRPEFDTNFNKFLENLDLSFQTSKQSMMIILDGRDVTQEIRRPDMGKWASDFSKLEAVRHFCSQKQRDIGCNGKVVAEGRDMGTVVFPDAKWKFFLTATLEERAKRRWLEERSRKNNSNYERVREWMQRRDTQDSNRKLAPLKPAQDARIIDTTDMQIHDVIIAITSQIKK